MKNITRRTAAKTIAAAAVLTPLAATGSTDGKVAALAARRAELSAAYYAADSRADDLLQSIPDDIRSTSQTVRHGGKAYTAYDETELAEIYDAKIQQPYAGEIIEWARATTGEDIQFPSTHAKAYRAWLREERDRAISKMTAAKARYSAAQEAAGVTQVEAEAARLSAAEFDTVHRIIDTPSAGPRDLLAKASLLEDPNEPGGIYVWHSEVLASLRRDLLAMGA